MLSSWNRCGRGIATLALAIVCAWTLPLFAALPVKEQAQTKAAAPASKEATTSAQRALSEQAQDIKKQALELNRDLFSLEEELLFPANTQVAVFVSLDAGEFFSLDAVQIKLDDKIVANYLYTPKQVDALRRGGVQRLYVGNVKGGKHEIVAVLTGRGPHNRDYRRGANYTFEKGDQTKYLELKIVDVTSNYEPEFQIKEWQ